jgi:hypothetical protein
MVDLMSLDPSKRLPSWSIIDALDLGVVYVPLDQYDDLAVRKLGHTRSR